MCLNGAYKLVTQLFAVVGDGFYGGLQSLEEVQSLVWIRVSL
jgi:hypothetical protein